MASSSYSTFLIISEYDQQKKLSFRNAQISLELIIGMLSYLPASVIRSILPSRFKYRDRSGIVVDILQTVGYASKGKTKTSIMRDANLNFDQVNKYLDLLLIHDIIKAEKPPSFNGQEKARYKLTMKGFQLMKDFETLRVAFKLIHQKPI